MSGSTTCGTCRHWNAGLCCRFPPVAAWAEGHRGFLFPETTEGMTCGEWSPKDPVATVTYTVATDELIERRDG